MVVVVVSLVWQIVKYSKGNISLYDIKVLYTTRLQLFRFRPLMKAYIFKFRTKLLYNLSIATDHNYLFIWLSETRKYIRISNRNI